MVAEESVCLRRLADGSRDGIVGYARFMANPRVTVEKVIAGWADATRGASAGRHVLAIQDSSDINFPTTSERRRGLGATSHGNTFGVLLHPMLAVDADDGALLGLVAGRIWAREGTVSVAHAKRRLADKESQRWLSTGEAAKTVLAAAALVTEVSDRESDIYAKWARLPEPGFHILTRAMRDRAIAGGGRLSSAVLQPGGEKRLELRARPGRPARTAHLVVRFGRVELTRPHKTPETDLPETVPVSLIEISEIDAPHGVEPILWRLLTTHDVKDPKMAWRVTGWYRQRWIIEQFFRTLKQQGLQLENSQLESADRLLKLTAIAARAACVIMQLVQARDGGSPQDAGIVFTAAEIETLQTLVPTLEGKTALQKNRHPPSSLAWAAWAIAKLGGWDGYPKSKPPGPITFRHGLQTFKAIARGWTLRDV